MISLSVLIMRNVSEKSFGENQNILCSVAFFIKLWCDDIMWKNMVQQDRLQITIYGTWALQVRLQTHSQNV